MILLIDNYDSFTYNLAQYLSEFDETIVLYNQDPHLYDMAKKADALVFSPGPGWPKEANQMPKLIQDFYQTKPILGVCLGHQAIAETLGETYAWLNVSCMADKAPLKHKALSASFAPSQNRLPSCATIPSLWINCPKTLS